MRTDATITDFAGPQPLATGSGTRRLLNNRVLVIAGVAGALSLATANPLMTLFSVVVAVSLIASLWRPGEPPVLLFACGIQWLQVTTVLHYANFAGADLVTAAGGTHLQWAVGLGLCGLAVLAFGAFLALRGADTAAADAAEREAAVSSPRRIFIAYLAAFVFVSLLKLVAGRVPGLAQVLGSAIAIRWMFLFLLCYVVLQRRRDYVLLWAVTAFEFGVGLLAFFSGFKSVFFLLIVALLAARQFWTARRVMLGCFVCVALVLSSIIWSAIKEEYREFLNLGLRSQQVLVPIPDRIDKLNELLSGLTNEGFFQGVDTLIARVGYVTYFALAIDNVPDRIPHENGRLWAEAVKHVLAPRMFFPDKPIIDDSERTTLYTGVLVAGAEQGASISIGYMGESYIDYGPVWMFVPIFLMGLVYGLIYRFFVSRAKVKMIGFAAATSVLLFAVYNFETSNVKLIGGIMMSFIVATAFLFIAESYVARAIREK